MKFLLAFLIFFSASCSVAHKKSSHINNKTSDSTLDFLKESKQMPRLQSSFYERFLKIRDSYRKAFFFLRQTPYGSLDPYFFVISDGGNKLYTVKDINSKSTQFDELGLKKAENLSLQKAFESLELKDFKPKVFDAPVYYELVYLPSDGEKQRIEFYYVPSAKLFPAAQGKTLKNLENLIKIGTQN